jgi:hypothetical protein
MNSNKNLELLETGYGYFIATYGDNFIGCAFNPEDFTRKLQLLSFLNPLDDIHNDDQDDEYEEEEEEEEEEDEDMPDMPDIYSEYFISIQKQIPFSYKNRCYYSFCDGIATYYASKSLLEIKKLLKGLHSIEVGDDAESFIKDSFDVEPFKIYKLNKDYKKEIPLDFDPSNN